MTQVTVLYDATMPGQRSLAREIGEAVRKSGGFSLSERGVSSSGEMSDFLRETTPENCQLLINVNLTGYENETTGGFAAINRLPMDIVNVITGSAEDVAPVLEKNQSYMSRFIFMKESEAGKAGEMFPHLWHVLWCRDAEKIAGYVKGLELRYG